MANGRRPEILGKFLATLAANLVKRAPTDGNQEGSVKAKYFKPPCFLLLVFALLGKVTLVRVRVEVFCQLLMIRTNTRMLPSLRDDKR